MKILRVVLYAAKKTWFQILTKQLHKFDWLFSGLVKEIKGDVNGKNNVFN